MEELFIEECLGGVSVAITDKVYVRHHRRLMSQLETRFPRGAFHGATLDVLFTGDLDKLDGGMREQVLGFSEAFLRCGCEECPFCGHPEEAFVVEVLELRAQGYSPEAIVDFLEGEYGMTMFAGDVASFLDSAVRTLEAAEDVAGVMDAGMMQARIRESRESLL